MGSWRNFWMIVGRMKTLITENVLQFQHASILKINLYLFDFRKQPNHARINAKQQP